MQQVPLQHNNTVYNSLVVYCGECMMCYTQLPVARGDGLSQWAAFKMTDEQFTEGMQVVTIRAELTPLDTSTMSVFSSGPAKVNRITIYLTFV